MRRRRGERTAHDRWGSQRDQDRRKPRGARAGGRGIAARRRAHRARGAGRGSGERVAGRMAVQEGAKYLEKAFGGSGILLGGVPGVLPAEVLVIGGGVVGANAAKMAAGLGAHVTLLDISLDRLRYLSDVLAPNVDLL